MATSWRGSAFHRMTLRQKKYFRYPRPLLFRCRLCEVAMIMRDRQGHIDRCHPGADILILFVVVR